MRVRVIALLALLLTTGCSHMALDEAQRLASAGDFETAFARLDDALRQAPADPTLRTAHARARDRVVVRALARAEVALAAGRHDEARRLLERVRDLEPGNARLAGTEANLQRAVGEREQARTRRAAAVAQEPPTLPATLGAAFRKPVTLEFREAPLRQVFETLARSTEVNFVFDREVRTDARITTFLRGVSLDEAVRLILASQQLDRKVLNDNTMLVYPNTPAKQREHQELVTRTLYLTNADVKQALQLLRTVTKTRDLHADERLNALVLRDTPEVVALAERLLATIDLPDPEVMMAVEILEVGSGTIENLGISWPSTIGFGVPNFEGQLLLEGGGMRGIVSNPALAAALRASVDSSNVLANPTVRARNREKARVQIGEKLPLFTTSSATANVGASTSVNLIDIGLKLELEPLVQLDGEVTIRIALEVSNLLAEVLGPNGSSAYNLGTRLTTTSLRLRDGETQVLAGLINDEDRKGISGLPKLAQAPFLGRLFGTHRDQRSRTEIVMLITPRIVRNLPLPVPAAATFASGTDQLPGAPTLRLASSARAGVGPAGAGPAPTVVPPPASAAADGPLVLSATEEAAVGETVSVTLANRAAQPLRGALYLDPQAFRAASPGAENGRVAFDLGPQQETVVVFRVLPAAAGAEHRVSLVEAVDAAGQGIDIGPQVEAVIRVPAATK